MLAEGVRNCPLATCITVVVVVVVIVVIAVDAIDSVPIVVIVVNVISNAVKLRVLGGVKGLHATLLTLCVAFAVL